MNNEVYLILPTGYRTRISDGVLDSSNGGVGYSLECRIEEIWVFQQIEEDQEVQLDFCGEVYDLVIVSKSISRPDSHTVDMRLAANNRVMRLDSPYSQPVVYTQDVAKNASVIVDELVDFPFVYDIVDWLIGAGKLQTDSSTALSLLTQIAEAPGGVVDALPNGDLWLRLPYPVPMNALDLAVVDQYYDDLDDNISVDTATVYRDGANRFRISEGDSAYSDSLEWIEDPVQSLPDYITGELRAYLSPYRTTAAIKHLGGAGTILSAEEKPETRVEMIQFSKGSGSTAKPIEVLLDIQWVTPSLGIPTFTPFSSALTVGTSVNDGYGLARVTYSTRYLSARVQGLAVPAWEGDVGPIDAYAYFVVEDTDG